MYGSTGYRSLTFDTLIDAENVMRDAFAEYHRSRRSGGTAMTLPPPPPQKRSPAIPRRVLIGIAAAGISRPAPLTPGGELLREVITPTAWEGVRQSLSKGVAFDFRFGHEGKPWLRSDDPRVTLTFDNLAGLLFKISADAAFDFKWPAGGVCSVGFQPLDVGKRYLRGGWVREIRALRLQHVAIEKRHKAVPYYEAARVVSVPPEQAGRTMVNLLVDARNSAKEAGL